MRWDLGWAGEGVASCAGARNEKMRSEIAIDAAARRKALPNIEFRRACSIVPRLLAYDEVAARADAPEAGTVPENAIDGSIPGRVARREKNLDAVAGPFGGGGVEIRSGEGNTALGLEFIEENIADGSGGGRDGK